MHAVTSVKNAVTSYSIMQQLASYAAGYAISAWLLDLAALITDASLRDQLASIGPDKINYASNFLSRRRSAETQCRMRFIGWMELAGG